MNKPANDKSKKRDRSTNLTALLYRSVGLGLCTILTMAIDIPNCHRPLVEWLVGVEVALGTMAGLADGGFGHVEGGRDLVLCQITIAENGRIVEALRRAVLP